MKKIKIGNIELQNNIILAPMAGYTNLAYREMMKEFGVGLTVSEMISDFALIYNNKETYQLLKTSQNERPVALQLFGSSKNSLLKGLKLLEDRADFDILDINMGCPVPKVVKENSGSSWVKKERQEELYDTVKAIVKASKHPVTIKIRIGFNNDEITVVETCKILEKAGVSLIAIHGRTRSQMYLGEADYSWIKKAKEAVKIPVIANGDINNFKKAKEVLDYTGADGIMIGRGCLGNPHLIRQINAYLKDGTELKDSTLKEQVGYLNDHMNRLIQLKGEYKAIHEMRGIATFYLKGFDNMKQFKSAMTRMETYDQFQEILKNVLEEARIQEKFMI